jgi:type I restriction enzyme, S subunit
VTAMQLLAHFDRLAEGPEAIPCLRRFILDLAIRGRLVAQDSKDVPPSEILKRIEAARQQVEGRRQRKAADTPPIRDDEVPFAISSGMVFARLVALANLEKGTTGIQKATPGEYPLVTLAEERATSENYQFDTAAAIVPLISSTGHGNASLKRMHYQEGRFALGNILCAVIPFAPDLISARFLYEYLWAYKEPLLVAKMTGTANVSLTIGKIGDAPIPIATPRSQARLHELMALCDRLEAAQAERERRRDRIAAASLDRLNRPDEVANEFRTHARFHVCHLSRLTVRPDQFPALRQTILNLAVHGRLVPQDPQDEPAPSFGIREDRERTDRLNYSLPGGWTWATVKDVAEARLGKMLDKAKNTGSPYRYLRNTNVHWFNIRKEELKTMRIEDSEVEQFLLRRGDVLICEGGHGIGRSAIWRSEEADIVFQKALHRVRPGPFLHSDFFAQCLFVYFHAGILASYYTGVGIPHFTGVALSKLVFPLPPFPEQLRIVAKVDALMAVCNRLESQLTTAQVTGRRLLEAVVHDALAATPQP